MYYNYNYNPNLNKIIPICFEDEIYMDITDLALPGVMPYYMVSNYGHIYSKNAGYIMSQNHDNRGYKTVGLATINGVKSCRVHRLVMATFYYRDDLDSLQVNHIDGNKENNKISNLEWVTQVENMAHAYATGLNNNYAENSIRAILTNDQVHFICQCLSQGMPLDEIEQRLGPTDIINIKGIMQGILRGDCWKSISKEYTFPKYESNIPYKFDDQQVEVICQCLEKNYNYKQVLEVLGIDISILDKNVVENYKKTISNIRSGKLYKHISCKYVMPTVRSCQTFSNEQIHHICKCLEKGYSFDRILEVLGINSSNSNIDQIFNYKSILSAIKNKARFKKISKDYNF